MTYRNSLVLIAVAMIAGACADEKKPAASALPATYSLTAPNVVNPKPDDDATRGSLNISDEIRKACGLADSETFFAFDSAKVRSEDQKIFTKLADCFSTGALKGREMRLVGYADPRGSADYNLALGGKRADNVKSVIEKFGLSEQKILTSSRGAMDAKGTDELNLGKRQACRSNGRQLTEVECEALGPRQVVSVGDPWLCTGSLSPWKLSAGLS